MTTKLTPTQKEILTVLAGQSPGYDVFPTSTCMIAFGHRKADVVAVVLEQLEALGLIDQMVYDVTDDVTGEVTEIPGGYEINTAGKTAHRTGVAP